MRWSGLVQGRWDDDIGSRWVAEAIAEPQHLLGALIRDQCQQQEVVVPLSAGRHCGESTECRADALGSGIGTDPQEDAKIRG